MIKYTLRVLWKNKFFSLLNIIGLTFGLSASIWLVMFLQNELTFDQHHPNHERVYRVSHIFSAPGVEFNTAYSASELSPMMKDEFPEIEAFARFQPLQVSEIMYNNQLLQQPGMFYTEPDVFDIFNVNLLIGNSESALSNSRNAIISKTVSEKLFGQENALDKTVKIDGVDMIVTGVFEDLPKNTHFTFEVLISGASGREWATQDGVFDSEVLWNADCASYLLFNEDTDIENFKAKFAPFNEKYFMPFGNKIEGSHTLRLQQLQSIHYDKEAINDDFAKGNPTNLVIFSIVGFAILLLACINYINLSTARAGSRAKEIAIRKVLGTNVNKLKLTILSESIVQVFLAYVLSVIVVWGMIEQTPLQSWLGVSFDFTLFENPQLLITSLVIVTITGFISGLYPAFYLSKINAVGALKGSWTANKSSNFFRQGLVLFQFVISIGVLLSTMLMKDQIDFLQTKDMGFSKDQILLINTSDSIAQSKYQVLKDALEANTAIEKVTSSNFVAGTDIGQIVFTVERDGQQVQQEFKFIHGDEDYLSTFEIPLAAGRSYNGQEARGNQYFVINEKAAEQLGWDDPIGKKLGFFHQEVPGQVIGVMKDFNHFSLHNPIEPLVFVFNSQPGRHLIVRFNQNRVDEALAAVTENWDQTLPNYPLEYSFLNDRMNILYEADRTQSKLIGSMTILCIAISLIGLTGLTSFNISQRKKEIGIRKVLGAMSFKIVALIFSSTLKLIVIASIIATPLSYYIISQWLQNFEYQTALDAGLMIFGVFSAVLLTFLLVGGLVMKTARKNPIDSLRYE